MSFNYKSICYTPEWHNPLLGFMQNVYPHRDMRYLDWWLSNIDYSKECWKKCVLILNGDSIIGCTTVNELEIETPGGRKKFFAQANTILSAEYRGKGISRLIYEKYNYPEWITIGFTDTAWKVQPRYVKSFVPIKSVNVYLSFSPRGFLTGQIWRMLLHMKLKDHSLPLYLSLGNSEEIVLCEDIRDLYITNDGKWMSDAIEIVRDKNFFMKRYLNNYRKKQYWIYQFLSKNRITGYLVLRTTVYKGLDMLSLVDFRFMKRDDEIKALKAAVKVAGMCGIGLVITLTSRRWGHRFSPLTIKTKKELHSAVGLQDYKNEFNDILITSADSDLDFVYYK